MDKSGVVDEEEEQAMFEEEVDADLLNIDPEEIEKAIQAKKKQHVYNELMRRGSHRESIDEMVARLNFKQYDEEKGSESLTIFDIFGTNGVEFKKQLPKNMDAVKNEDQYLIYYDYTWNSGKANRRNRLNALTTRHLDSFVDPLIR